MQKYTYYWWNFPELPNHSARLLVQVHLTEQTDYGERRHRNAANLWLTGIFVRAHSLAEWILTCLLVSLTSAGGTPSGGWQRSRTSWSSATSLPSGSSSKFFLRSVEQKIMHLSFIQFFAIIYSWLWGHILIGWAMSKSVKHSTCTCFYIFLCNVYINYL